MKTGFKLGSSLYLYEVAPSECPVTPEVETTTNHVVVIDCSGSMYGELPRIREQLKKKLPKLIGEKDTLSVIWFSGRGEFGTLIEAEPVSTLKDLNEVNKAIDRWLKPVGLTGFKEPLEEVAKLIDRIGKDKHFSLFFMSDGQNNVGSKEDIIKVVSTLSSKLVSATFVEYGYYADRPLLTAMAEKAGGQLIFAEHFDKYQPAFEAILSKKTSADPKVKVSISEDVVGQFAFTCQGGELTAYSIDDGSVLVPFGTTVWYLSKEDPQKDLPVLLSSTPENHLPTVKAPGVIPVVSNKGTSSPDSKLGALYSAVALFTVRMRPEVVLPLLKCLGDVQFIEQFSSCFGKQKYSDFMEAAKAAAFDPTLRYRKGYDPSKIPSEDAFTVLDLLKLLLEDEGSRILLDHPEFKYSKIGRSRIDADELLNEEEQAKVTELTLKLAKEKNAKKIKALQAELATVMGAKKDSLQFKADEAPDGYPITNLVFNEDRPNVSLQVRKTGTVDIQSRMVPEHSTVDALFRTFIFRNYAIIKDGLVNVDHLPVRVSPELAIKLATLLPEEAKPQKLKASETYVEGVINLRALPVINQRMIKTLSATKLFEEQFRLESARAAQKVYKAYRDEKSPKKESASFKTIYGDATATWLKELGFTDYSGFSPAKTVTAEATDFYVGKELTVSIKGLSSLPKVADVKAKMGSSKATIGVTLMAPYVKEVEEYLSQNPDNLTNGEYMAWIDAKAKDSIRLARGLIHSLATQKFAVIVGQSWFSEFASLDENTQTLNIDGNPGLVCKVNLKEIEVKI